MISLVLGKPELSRYTAPWEEFEGYQYPTFSSYPTKVSNTQELIDFYLKETARFQKGDIICNQGGIVNYYSVFVVVNVFNKLEEYTAHHQMVNDIDYLQLKTLGITDGTGPAGSKYGNTGYSRRSNQNNLRFLTTEEKEKWVNVDVQTQLKEWGLIP